MMFLFGIATSRLTSHYPVLFSPLAHLGPWPKPVPNTLPNPFVSMSSPTKPAATDLPVAPLLRVSAAFCVLFASMAIMSPTLDALVRQPYGLTNEATSQFMQASSAAGILAGLAMGWVADWWGRRVMMLAVALGVSGVLTALFPHAGRFDVLLGLRFAEGFATSTALMLAMARAADLATPATRPRVMAILMSAVPVGYLLGQPMAAALGEVGLGVLFGVMGGLLVGSGLILLTDRRHEVTVEPARIGGMGATLLQLPSAWLPILINTTDKFTVAALAVALPLMVKDSLGINPMTWAAGLMAVYWLAFLVATWPAGKLAAAWGLAPTSLWALVAYGVALAALANVGLAGAFVLMGVLGLVTAFQFVPNMALLSECAQPHQRATFMAASNLLGSLGMIVGFAVVGTLSDASYELAFLVTGLVAIAAGAAGILISGALGLVRALTPVAVAPLAPPRLVAFNPDASDLGVGK